MAIAFPVDAYHQALARQSCSPPVFQIFFFPLMFVGASFSTLCVALREGANESLDKGGKRNKLEGPKPITF
ncbi:MAG: hypothetical protein ACJA09_000951 [Alcanivorax sp.]|jgi:hypothetical protein